MRHEKFHIEETLRSKLPAGAEQRQNQSRAQIDVICEVRQGIDPWMRVRLADLSISGFRLAYAARYRENEPVRIKIDGLSPISARIRWRAGPQIGCEFEQPLHVAVFEHILKKAQC